MAPRRFWRSSLVIVAVTAAATLIFRDTILRRVGDALIVDEPIQPADAIVVPEWTQAVGALEAADLVALHVSTKVAVFVDDTEDPVLNELRRRGVSLGPSSWTVRLLTDLNVDDVERVPAGPGSHATAETLRKWCEHHDFRTVIVISLPDHSRRLRRLLDRSMKGQKTRTILRTSRYSQVDPARWWRTQIGVRAYVEEIPKLLLDVALHPLG
jgi:hypothetical protein